MVKSSEHIETIPLTFRLQKKKEKEMDNMSDTEQNPTNNKSWVSKYRERTTDIDKSFHDFVLKHLNLNVKATDSLRLPHILE